MKTTVAAILLAALLAFALWRASDTTDARAVVAEAKALLASKDSALAAQRELTDSAEARLVRAQARTVTVTRLVEVARIDSSLADSLASTATTLGEMRSAYEVRSREADTLRLALRVSRAATDDALASIAFWQLRNIGDSTRIRNLEYSLAEMVRVSKKRWRDRLGVNVGYGAVVTGSVIRTGPTVSVAARIWP